jgi:type I restriction enzyme R subunit
MTDTAYLTPEAKARVQIDAMLDAAGWAVQDSAKVNLAAARGVAVREFVLAPGHGRADYLLFLDGQAVGALEAKNVSRTSSRVHGYWTQAARRSSRCGLRMRSAGWWS